MNKFMEEAFNQAMKAYKKNEVPVGAVIVKDGKIISKAHNMKEHKKSAIKHAEILAIEKASKKLKTWHLDGCELYVTLEPCMMCCGAIEQSRITKVYYSTESKLYGQIENNYKVFENKKIQIFNNIESSKSKKILGDFFKNKRK